MLRWGLIPSWAKAPHIGSRLINARAETAATKSAFEAAWRARRCLIPADGFCEWNRRDAAKQPWLFELKDGEPFAFAGLWECWTVRERPLLLGSLREAALGEAIETCTILTTRANRIVAPVHDRMPVILQPQSFDSWLAGEAVPLEPYPSESMTSNPVSALVNQHANDDARCVEPVAVAESPPRLL